MEVTSASVSEEKLAKEGRKPGTGPDPHGVSEEQEMEG